ncbi:MAG TPA: EAL domain-containing protein [Baekduia sp.]|nr:EAL domain-containing protein [Baekduia sp.]
MELTSAYQPIVNLESGEIFGYEALARDATGKFPAAAFDAARANGTLAALDWECRASAVRGALEAGLRPPVALFINNEPGVIREPPPERLRSVLTTGARSLDLYSEITERAIAKYPAELLQRVFEMRSRGCSIAIDDVGANPRSLAMLPVLKPDVIKLDLSLIQAKPDLASAAVMTSVAAYAQATGATILAEGIETEQHLLNAITLGATLGQGWLFGHPGPLPQGRPIEITPAPQPPPPVPQLPEPELPSAIVGRKMPLRPGNPDFLMAISKHLEHQALALGQDTVVVSCFGHAQNFASDAREHYAQLARTVGIVVVLGEGVPDEPAPDVRGGALDPDDVLIGEWTVAVLSPRYSAALVARNLNETGTHATPRFEFALTFDAEDVADVVRALLPRIGAEQAMRVPLAA